MDVFFFKKRGMDFLKFCLSLKKVDVTYERYKSGKMFVTFNVEFEIRM